MDPNATLNPSAETQPWRLCPKPWASPLSLALGALRGGHAPRWPQFDGARVHLTHTARTAIAAVLDAIGVNEGDEALVPWYHCGTEIDPLVRSGLRIVPYRVGLDLNLDLNDLDARITPRTRIVYVTHFFGWGQDLTSLAKACTRVGAVLIEDCALALFSGPARRPLGTVGDAAVFSFPKTLGVPDGGALSVRGALPEIHVHRGAPLRTTAHMSSRLTRRWAGVRMSRVGALERFARRADKRWARKWNERIRDNARLREMPADFHFDRRLLDRGCSRITRGVIQSVDPLDVSARRRSNFLRLVSELGDLAPELLLRTGVPEMVCPLAAPMLVPDRDRWVGALREAGIAVTPWWDGFHPAMMENPPPETVRMKTQMIALPVHQDLDERDMAHIAHCVRRLAFDQTAAKKNTG